jgi:hypothetical protein
VAKDDDFPSIVKPNPGRDTVRQGHRLKENEIRGRKSNFA